MHRSQALVDQDAPAKGGVAADAGAGPPGGPMGAGPRPATTAPDPSVDTRTSISPPTHRRPVGRVDRALRFRRERPKGSRRGTLNQFDFSPNRCRNWSPVTRDVAPVEDGPDGQRPAAEGAEPVAGLTP